ncbi:unnamed protein product, partial [Rotaria sp. Silwood2]
IASELSATTTNPPSAITVADLDTDEMSIRFRDIVEEFLRKFSSRVTQTTHLITNGDKHPLRSPLSIELIEAIANHYFCVSIKPLR